MNNHRVQWKAILALIVITFASGCVPEDSLEWSEDGSVGLLRVQGVLYMVDGQTGGLTEIAKDEVLPWPDISKDGSLIVYIQKVECSNLLEGLKLLPHGQVKMIEFYANQVKRLILNTEMPDNNKFPFPSEGPLVPHNYRNWVIRYICETSDTNLLQKIGDEQIQKGKEEKIVYFQIIVVPRDSLDKKRIIATNLFTTRATQLSPNGKFVAYLMHNQQGQVDKAFEEYGLYVASLDGVVKAMLVSHPVSIGYSWRDDSRAIAYLEADSKNLIHAEPIMATLKERFVIDGNDSLLAKPASILQGSAETHWCTGKSEQMAGTMFNPWMKVDYALSRRVFFSSPVASIPSSNLDEEKWSLFSYDSVTRTVANVLPSSISDYVEGNVNLFAISPDGRKVILPMRKNRFAIYELGKSSANVPINEDEMFGDENVLKFAPAWKGNNEISCLVSEKSHFLTKKGQEKHHRKEIVILGADGKFLRVLSENWPGKPIEKLLK